MAKFVKIEYYKRSKDNSANISREDIEAPYCATINVDNIDFIVGPVNASIHVYTSNTSYTSQDMNVVQIYMTGGYVFLCPKSEYNKIVNSINEPILNNE